MRRKEIDSYFKSISVPLFHMRHLEGGARGMVVALSLKGIVRISPNNGAAVWRVSYI